MQLSTAVARRCDDGLITVKDGNLSQTDINALVSLTLFNFAYQTVILTVKGGCYQCNSNVILLSCALCRVPVSL